VGIKTVGLLAVLLVIWGCGYINYSVNGTVRSALVVADFANNRVLIWRKGPSSIAEPAAIVLGQPDFTSNLANNGLANPTAQTLSGPRGAFFDGQHLFVSEKNNNRVLIWNSLPTRNQQPADLVLGQPDFTTATANTNGPSAQSLSWPEFIYSDGASLYVSDRANNRVLKWNSIPTRNTQEANLVLGQPDMGTVSSGTNSQKFSSPGGMIVVGGRLYVTDVLNHRVLIWSSIPTVPQQPADLVLGQSTMNSGGVNAGGGALNPTQKSLNLPAMIASDGTRIAVTEYFNHRVVIWNNPPTTSFQQADVVLGQASFTTNSSGAGAQQVFEPTGIAFDGQRLLVCEEGNNRLLVWNNIPTQNQASADFVLGQANFTATTANAGGISASTMSACIGVQSNNFVIGAMREGGY
jgi:hypothetical protein